MVIAATGGVSDDEQGLASGLFNTTLQVGSGLVLAIVVAVSSARTTALLQQGGNTSKVAVTAGLQYALFACVGFALLAVLAALFVIRERKDTPDPQHTPVAKDDSRNHPTPSSPITVGKGERQYSEEAQ
jgi:hypothetical protein